MPGSKVVPLRPEDSSDIIDVFKSQGYEIYVGDELCEGDALEALSEGRNGQVTPVDA